MRGSYARSLCLLSDCARHSSHAGGRCAVYGYNRFAAWHTGAIITSSAVLYDGMRVLSSLVLLILGWRAWNAPARGFVLLEKEGKITEETPKTKASTILFSAMVLQATNPVLYVFVLSLLPQFIDPKEAFLPQVSLLIGIFGTTVLVIHLSYSFLAAWARKFLASPRAAKLMNRISGALFALLGISVLAQLFMA